MNKLTNPIIFILSIMELNLLYRMYTICTLVYFIINLPSRGISVCSLLKKI